MCTKSSPDASFRRFSCRSPALPTFLICVMNNIKCPNRSVPHFSISKHKDWFWRLWRRWLKLSSKKLSPRNRISAFMHVDSNWSTLMALKCFTRFWKFLRNPVDGAAVSVSIANPHWAADNTNNSGHECITSRFCSLDENWLNDDIDLIHRIVRNKSFIAESVSEGVDLITKFDGISSELVTSFSLSATFIVSTFFTWIFCGCCWLDSDCCECSSADDDKSFPMPKS